MMELTYGTLDEIEIKHSVHHPSSIPAIALCAEVDK